MLKQQLIQSIEEEFQKEHRPNIKMWVEDKNTLVIRGIVPGMVLARSLSLKLFPDLSEGKYNLCFEYLTGSTTYAFSVYYTDLSLVLGEVEETSSSITSFWAR